jgi:hypothetical protein
MKKLKLEIENLSVESFATVAETESLSGTVEGREMLATGEFTCNQTTPYCKTILTYCPCTPRWEQV